MILNIFFSSSNQRRLYMLIVCIFWTILPRYKQHVNTTQTVLFITFSLTRTHCSELITFNNLMFHSHNQTLNKFAFTQSDCSIHVKMHAIESDMHGSHATHYQTRWNRYENILCDRKKNESEILMQILRFANELFNWKSIADDLNCWRWFNNLPFKTEWFD